MDRFRAINQGPIRDTVPRGQQVRRKRPIDKHTVDVGLG